MGNLRSMRYRPLVLGGTVVLAIALIGRARRRMWQELFAAEARSLV
jgi:hypothetical protein